MRILYAIQGTGNGHLSRARDVIPALKERGEVDILVSGIQADVVLPYDVDHRYHGMSFIFGKKGGVDLRATWKKNNLRQIIKEVKACPVEKYDLVINDFEPISAWACRFKKVPCVGLSHQAALTSDRVPRPVHSDWLGQLILNYYAPTKEKVGFHFMRYDNFIFTPVVRKEIREQEVCDNGHYTVYLPAYGDDKLVEILSKIHSVKWHVFSKHNEQTFVQHNVKVQPINNEDFIKSMASAKGILCGAGFETPAEALFLNKKLMIIPMKSQYEQHFNAAALTQLGVPSIKKLKKKHVKKIKAWVKDPTRVRVYYPNQTQFIVDGILEKFIRDVKVTDNKLIVGALNS